MATSVESPPAPAMPPIREPASSRVRTIYRIGAWAAIAVVVLVAVNAVVLFLYPIPDTVLGHFRQIYENKLVGLVNLDLVMLISEGLAVVVYLALYTALRQGSRWLASIGIGLGMSGVFLYFAVNPTFSFLYLSDQYATASTAAERAALIAAGDAVWASYQGTAFATFYLLTAVAALVFAAAMLRTGVFSPLTAYVGLVSGAAALIPPLPAFGQVGVIASFVALVPMVAFELMIAWRLLHLAAGSGMGSTPAGDHWR